MPITSFWCGRWYHQYDDTRKENRVRSCVTLIMMAGVISDWKQERRDERNGEKQKKKKRKKNCWVCASHRKATIVNQIRLVAAGLVYVYFSVANTKHKPFAVRTVVFCWYHVFHCRTKCFYLLLASLATSSSPSSSSFTKKKKSHSHIT